MEKIKRILSIVLVCVMTIALAPVVSPENVSAAATGTTALFNGNATYLLQERFNAYFALEANGGEANSVMSGWDVDYRGGKVTSNGGVATLTDNSGFEKTDMSHQLMKHTGDGLVMEASFQYTPTTNTPMDGGFHYTLSGDGKTAVKIDVQAVKEGNAYNYYFHVNGQKTDVACAANTVYHVKAELSTSSKTVNVWINGAVAATGASYVEAATCIDDITVGTTDEMHSIVKLYNVFVYVNYTVNETFIGAPLGTTPAWWTTADVIAKAPGSPYPADVNGLSLSAGGVKPSIGAGAATPVNINYPLNSSSELTWVQSGVTVSNASGIGGRNNVVKATGVANSNNNTVGVKLGGTGFAFQEGDVITYSVDYYTAANASPQMWLRRHTGTLEPFRSKSFSVTGGTWTTLTETIPFESLGGTANQNTWTDAGQYALYVRSGASEIYLDNFKVTVTREADNTATASSGVLYRDFNELSGKQSFVWNMLVPSAGADGFEACFGGAEFTLSGGKFYLNGQDAGSYRKNTWYKVEIRTNGSTADILINDVVKATGVSASGVMDSIMLVNGSSSAVIVDDIQVYKTFATTDYADYPSPDSVVKTDGWHLGMVVYPMWYEGTHYGWDAITPYEDRTPYQGYYTGGSKEVSDWDAKWMLEHGIDHAIYPFVNPKAGEQAKMSVRGEALAGYKAGEYTDDLSFAMMMTNPLDSNLNGAEDYITNAVPYIVEHNFKNPAYKKIDGRLPVYMYNPEGFASRLGGDSGLNTVLEALNTEAINLGYSGIIYMVDISSLSSSSYIDTFKTNCSPSYPVYKWKYGWSTDIANGIAQGIKYEYENYSDVVASVPMGFDNTPWRSNDIDMMTPEQVKSIVASIPANIGDDDPHIVLFTCWDEWGEGHFYAPSTQGGFGYLNAIREVVAGAAKTDEDMPSADSVKRMSVLHPEGRQILKIRDDRKIYTTADLAGFTQLGTVSLQNVSSSHNDTRSSIFGSWTCPGWTHGTLSGCTMTATASNTSEGSGTFATSRSHSGTLSNIVYTITNPKQATVNWDISNLGLDLSKVSAIKVNGYAENSALMVINFATSETDDTDYSANLRFCAAGDGDTTAKDYILLPDVVGGPAGTATKVRFNPAQMTAVGSKFQINSITFYQGEFEEVKVYIDDKETHLVSEAVVSGGETYIPAYQFLLNAGCYVEWDKATKKLTVEKDGITAVFQDGNKAVTVTGGDNITMSSNAYYEDGNLYVPYDYLLAPFGYTVSTVGDDIYYYNEFWTSEYDDTDLKWDFEIDGDNDSWTVGSGVKITTRDGLLHVRSTGTDPTIRRSGFSLSTDDYKYLVMKVKKSDITAKGMMRLYSGSNLPSAGGVVYNYTIEPSDDVQTIVFDLANDYDTSSSRSAFSELGGTVTNLRMDPLDTGFVHGSFYIDSIEFTNENPNAPVAPEMVAYAFEDENMFDLTIDKIGTQYSNLLNANGTTAGDVLPPVETVDGYENVMKLVPSAGNNAGLFNLTAVWYNNARVVTQKVAEGDEIVKISFWYKAVGNGTGFRVENRQGGTLDGELITKTDASTTEWKYFEDYLDMSKVADASRWFSIRIYRNGTSVDNGGLYVRDYKLVCLDQENPVTTYDDTIAVCLSTYDGTDTANIGKMHISEHNTSDEVLRKINSDNYPVVKSVTRGSGTANETQKYFFYRPKATDSDKIRCFLWDNTQAPVTEVLELERAN